MGYKAMPTGSGPRFFHTHCKCGRPITIGGLANDCLGQSSNYAWLPRVALRSPREVANAYQKQNQGKDLLVSADPAGWVQCLKDNHCFNGLDRSATQSTYYDRRRLRARLCYGKFQVMRGIRGDLELLKLTGTEDARAAAMDVERIVEQEGG